MRSGVNCGENRRRWVREGVGGLYAEDRVGGAGRDVRLSLKAQLASSALQFFHPPSILTGGHTDEPCFPSMFKQHDKVSRAQLTLTQAMFETDPALEKPSYHEDLMPHGCCLFFSPLIPQH